MDTTQDKDTKGPSVIAVKQVLQPVKTNQDTETPKGGILKQNTQTYTRVGGGLAMGTQQNRV